MSHPAPPNAIAAAAVAGPGSSAKPRPRHFWDGPNPTDDEEKQSADHTAPVTRLYRHTLESIFRFLTLHDLSRVLSVCRAWSAAVRSMPSIGATVNRPSLLPVQLAASGLAPHVGALGAEWPVNTTFDCSGLLLLSQRLSSLISLSGQVAMPQPTPLCFPAKIRSLNIRFAGAPASAESINAAIVTISRLALLTTLTLGLPSLFPQLHFSPLSSAAKLRFLVLEPADPSQPTAEQMDQLRALRSLSTMVVDDLSSSSLEYLLRVPHDLAWQRLNDFDPLAAGGMAALLSLPGLTHLAVHDCPTVSFLPSLKKLQYLDLLLSEPWPVPVDAIVEAVSQCSQLRGLILSAPVSSTHVNDILSHLPLLDELTFFGDALESLAFLSEPKPIPCSRTLTKLELYYCRNPAFLSTELRRLSSLPSLATLDVRHSFREPLCALAQWMLTPPSLLLPNLKTFHFKR